MTERDWLEPAMTALVKIERGEASPGDYAAAREALLRVPPSGTIYRRIVKALEDAPMPGSLPQETAPSTPLPTHLFPNFEDGGAFSGGIDPRGKPTADFLDMGPLKHLFGGSDNASASDIPGSPPPGARGLDPSTPLPVEEAETRNAIVTDYSQFPGGGGQMAAGHGLDRQEESGPLDVWMDMEDGTYMGGGPHAIDIYSRNPEAYLTQYAEDRGGGANMAAYLSDPYYSALAMARTGLLGGGAGNSLYSGAGMGQAGVMQRAEEFLDQYSQPGQFVDPGMIMEEMVNRGASTNFEGRMNPQTRMPMTPEDIVDITNESIMAAAPFMGPQGAEHLQSVLQGAANQYINAIATGEIDANISYPNYLKSLGIDKMLTS